MSYTIMLTGGTGYLGSHVAQAMVKTGHHVVIAKRRLSKTTRLASIAQGISFHDLDEEDLSDLFSNQRIDAVIHCATNYGRDGEALDALLASNLREPLRVLQAALKHQCRAFFNIDTALPDNLNAYTLSKSQFRQWGTLLTTAHSNSLTRFINIKLEHFYGPHENDHSFTARVIKACVQHQAEFQLTKGEQLRDFVYIEDVIQALRKVITHVMETERCLHEFEIGSGQPVSIRQFVETIHRLTQSTTQLVFGALPYRTGEVMHSCPDLTNIKQLGWHAKTTIEEGLLHTLHAYNTSQ